MSKSKSISRSKTLKKPRNPVKIGHDPTNDEEVSFRKQTVPSFATLAHRLECEAHLLAAALKRSRKRIVFAESCTAGLISATLGQIPGISENLCGSSVVYRIDTKTKWLGLSSSVVRQCDAVTPEVARQLASRVLSLTPEADFAASITGHLGPSGDSKQDGHVYVGIASRRSKAVLVCELWIFPSTQKALMQRTKQSKQRAKVLRKKRQMHASLEVLILVRSMLK